MKKSILGIILLLGTVLGCKKSSSEPAPAAIPYMSITANSTWQYQQTSVTPPTPPVNYTLTSTSRDTTINGRNYHVFTNSNGNTSEYYNITGSDYYQYRDLPAALGSGKIEALYLKDNLALNGSWSQSLNITVSGINLPITLTYTIIEKGAAKTVNGVNYTDVIGVKTAITVNNPLIPPTALVTDIKNYYARKFGLIQSETRININFSGVVQNTENQNKLLSADIK